MRRYRVRRYSKRAKRWMMPELAPRPAASADDAERMVAGARYGRELFSCEPLGRAGTSRQARTYSFSVLGYDPAVEDDRGDEATGEATPRAPAAIRFRPRTKRNRLAAGA